MGKCSYCKEGHDLRRGKGTAEERKWREKEEYSDTTSSITPP